MVSALPDSSSPETQEIFFRKDIEGRILFGRHDDNVEVLIDRRNNEDVLWRKTK